MSSAHPVHLPVSPPVCATADAPLRPGRLARGVGVLLGLLAACGGDGRLLISLERPAAEALDPLRDPRLAKLSLRIIDEAAISDQEAFIRDGSELEVGNVPVGRPFDLRLAGKSSTGQMLGLGQVFDVELAGDRTTAIEVKFRKPLAYVGGEPGVQVLDATASTRDDVPLEGMAGLSGITGLAASPDGAWLIAVAGRVLAALRTSDGVEWGRVNLPGPGTCVAVSPDNGHAVVCHPGASRVSVVDLRALAEGREAAPVPVDVGGPPSRIVFGGGEPTARVLVEGATSGSGCEAGSRLVEVDLVAARTLRQVDLGKPVADIAVDPRDGALLLALPCDAALGRLEGNQAAVIPVQVPRHYDLAISDQDLVVIGPDAGDPELADAVMLDLTRPGFEVRQTRPFRMPTLSMWFKNLGAAGELGWLLKLDQLAVEEVAVSPDGQRALAQFQATYSSDMNAFGCAYLLDMKATGYLVVDLTVDLVIYWRLTRVSFDQCSIPCSYPTKAQCEEGVRGSLRARLLANPEYAPRGAVLLFGGS